MNVGDRVVADLTAYNVGLCHGTILGFREVGPSKAHPERIVRVLFDPGEWVTDVGWVAPEVLSAEEDER
jgi:hypothetical protein